MKRLRQLVVDFWPSKAKWPFSEDKDFSTEVLAPLGTYEIPTDGGTVQIDSAAFPIYSIYAANGWKLHEESRVPGDINNILVPDASIMYELASQLRQAADRFDIISWHHATHCYPAVASEVLSRYKLSILHFGDDCPGSSERKSFPCVQYFDAAVHRMLVWNYATGQRVPDMYRNAGFRGRCYHNVGSQTDSLWAWLKETGFSLEEKIQRFSAGSLPIDLVWLGCIGRMNPARQLLLSELNKLARSIPLAVRLHGKEMRDGYYQCDANSGPFDLGRAAAQLYNSCATGLNFPASSFFNGRLFDLPLTGVAPIMYDPHGELTSVGMLPGKHYATYDGTLPSLLETVQELLRNRSLWTHIVKQANAVAYHLLKTSSTAAVYNRVILDHLERFK